MHHIEDEDARAKLPITNRHFERSEKSRSTSLENSSSLRQICAVVRCAGCFTSFSMTNMEDEDTLEELLTRCEEMQQL